MKCPICKKEVSLDEPESPFCSKRCRLFDLGNWASGKYAIPGPPMTEQTKESPESEDDEV